MSAPQPAIRLADLHVGIDGHEILRGVDLELLSGSCLGVVGQSGSGKSMTARALAGLLPAAAQVSGSYLLDGRPVDLAAGPATWRTIRGRRVVWLPQDPFTSLDPLRRCGAQIMAARPDVRRLGRRERESEVATRLREVGLPAAVAAAYPYQLSGGMRQRVAIAAALAPGPQVLIADEPTTALDVTAQAGVLDLLARLRSEYGMSMVLITHDLFLARERCDRLAVFHAGQVVETGPTEEVVTSPRHEHTRSLVAAGLADHPGSAPLTAADEVLVAEGLTKTYQGSSRPALAEASIRLAQGEIVGIVGESGSGKTTLARCVLGLETPDAGEFGYLAADGARRPWSPGQAQLVFQNPYASLNPSMTVRQTLAEALRSAGRTSADVPELLRLVGLDPALAARKPARLSGGERQRVAIARALAPRPRVLVCDEAVSALDAPVQVHVLATLAELRERLGLSVLFISHDLALVGRLAQRVYVLYRGRIVESGTAAQVLTAPRHPYTRELVGSIPGRSRLEPDREAS